jgi:hypothetical protein
MIRTERALGRAGFANRKEAEDSVPSVPRGLITKPQCHIEFALKTSLGSRYSVLFSQTKTPDRKANRTTVQTAFPPRVKEKLRINDLEKQEPPEEYFDSRPYRTP